MTARTTISCALLGAALTAGPALAQDCSRDQIQLAVDGYLNAQGSGNPYVLDIVPTFSYRENMEDAHLSGGVLSEPKRVDFHIALLDEVQCRGFVELVSTFPDPYVTSAHFDLDEEGRVASMEVIVTDPGDWLFSAERFLDGVKDEDWRIQPERQRVSRETLQAAADSYFDYFADREVEVPWGLPCYRQEGGLRTETTCDTGVPPGGEFPDRDYVIDTQLGAAVAIVKFGPSELPDSHLFRVESGYITNIHALTVCREPNCGFDLPEALQDP